MRFVIAIGNILKDIRYAVARAMAFKLRWALIIFGAVFAYGALPPVVMPLWAEARYAPAVATVKYVGWACRDGVSRPRWCSAADIAASREAKAKLTKTHLVVFTYTDADGTVHRQDWLYTRTGLREREAVRGHRFSILVDPADPRRVSMRFGADLRNTLISAAALLSFFLGVSWWVAAFRRDRRRAAQERFVPVAGPVFTPDGRRIRPLEGRAAFGRRAPSRV